MVLVTLGQSLGSLMPLRARCADGVMLQVVQQARAASIAPGEEQRAAGLPAPHPPFPVLPALPRPPS